MTCHIARRMVANDHAFAGRGHDGPQSMLKPRDGCTMEATKIAGGYRYKKICRGETTTGTAIGDFNSAYKN